MLKPSSDDVSLCLVAQLCPTLCDPVDCSLPGFSVHGDSPGKNTGMGCYAFLQGIFPTQRLNPGLPHCRRSLPFEPLGKPKNTGVGSLSLFLGIFPTQESNHGLLHCRWILYQLSYQGSLYKKRCIKFQGSTFRAKGKQNQNRLSTI